MHQLTHPNALRSMTTLPVAVLLLLGCADGTAPGDRDDTESEHDADTVDTNIVNDIDGGCDPSRCTEDIALPQGAKDGDFVVVQNFATDDQTIALSLAWHIGDGTAVGETFPFEMLRFGMCDSDGGACISNADALTYQWQHHNWDDTITATVDSRTFEVSMQFTNLTGVVPWTDTLVVSDTTGPTSYPLKDTGCRTVPSGNLNACVLRTRLDE